MAELAAASVRLTPAPRETQWMLQADPADRGALADALGIALPDAMLTSAATGGWTALHCGPEEWLLIGDGDRPQGPDAVPHSLVDISQRSLALDLEGPGAAALIAGGCGLDLATIAPGGCTRTLFGKVTVLLWRRGAESWRMIYARSFDGYVRALIAAIAQDLD